MSIPGVAVYHQRSTWEKLLPARYQMAAQNPPKQVPADIFRPVVHYPGVDDVPDGDPGERLEDVAQSVANSHRYYVDNRGYAYGYLFVVDWTGGVWEVRGFDYRSAANSGHNQYTCPVQLLIDATGTPTDRQIDAAVAVFREFRRRAGRTDFESRPWGHGELQKRTGIGTVTTCPGTNTQRLIDQGRFDLPDEPEPAPEPPAEEPEVSAYLWRPKGYDNVFVIDGGDALHVSQRTFNEIYKDLPKVFDDPHKETLKSVLAKAGLTESDLVPV